VDHFASPDRRYRLEQLVSGYMDNDDAERQGLEIVLVLESAIGGDEYITLQLIHKHMVFQALPAEIKKGPDLISPGTLRQAADRWRRL
jgi:hypothetical protein